MPTPPHESIRIGPGIFIQVFDILPMEKQPVLSSMWTKPLIRHPGPVFALFDVCATRRELDFFSLAEVEESIF